MAERSHAGTSKKKNIMIEIGQNPNTKQCSVAILMHGYFGLGRDGIKLVDSDKVFPIESVIKVAEIPSNAFDMLQKAPSKLGENMEDNQRDNRGRFIQGHRVSVGNKGGRPSKTPITDRVKEVLDNKFYERKDGKHMRAIDLYAESLVDRAILQGNGKAIDTVYERIEGKVTQSVKLSGAVAQGNLSEEALERMAKIFPDTK